MKRTLPHPVRKASRKRRTVKENESGNRKNIGYLERIIECNRLRKYENMLVVGRGRWWLAARKRAHTKKTL